MDTIWGKVKKVVDGDTFDVNVTHIRTDNDYDYNNVERVRLARGDAPELGSPLGALASAALAARLNGAEVRVRIHTRDKYGRLIGSVSVL